MLRQILAIESLLTSVPSTESRCDDDIVPLPVDDSLFLPKRSLPNSLDRSNQQSPSLVLESGRSPWSSLHPCSPSISDDDDSIRCVEGGRPDWVGGREGGKREVDGGDDGLKGRDEVGLDEAEG